MSGKNKADDCPPLPMPSITAALCYLLAQAEAEELPQPHYVTASKTEHIDLQFEPVMGSEMAIVMWTLHFGAVVTVSIVNNQRWINSDFEWYGCPVHMYAHIPLPAEEAPRESAYVQCHCDACASLIEEPGEFPPF